MDKHSSNVSSFKIKLCMRWTYASGVLISDFAYSIITVLDIVYNEQSVLLFIGFGK